MATRERLFSRALGVRLPLAKTVPSLVVATFSYAACEEYLRQRREIIIENANAGGEESEGNPQNPDVGFISKSKALVEHELQIFNLADKGMVFKKGISTGVKKIIGL